MPPSSALFREQWPRGGREAEGGRGRGRGRGRHAGFHVGLSLALSTIQSATRCDVSGAHPFVLGALRVPRGLRCHRLLAEYASAVAFGLPAGEYRGRTSAGHGLERRFFCFPRRWMGQDAGCLALSMPASPMPSEYAAASFQQRCSAAWHHHRSEIHSRASSNASSFSPTRSVASSHRMSQSIVLISG